MVSNLIIAPHPDDEVLGCYSFLPQSFVLYITTYHPLFPEGENNKERLELSRTFAFGMHPTEGKGFETNKLDKVPIERIIDKIEKYINIKTPHTVLIPNPSYNQDHRVVYDAALTAMRHHDRNHFVKRVLLYEQPETWDTMRKPRPFDATYFRKIDIDAKIEAISIYQSQLRGHRSLEYIHALSKIRGQQANMDYAEAFEVVRWIE